MTTELCAKCKQPAVHGPILKALGQHWHEEHFVCNHCQAPFPNGQFYDVDGAPYCVADYFSLFGEKCGRCNEPIRGDLLRAVGKVWHPEHFTCDRCSSPLADAYFVEADGVALCEECNTGVGTGVGNTTGVVSKENAAEAERLMGSFMEELARLETIARGAPESLDSSEITQTVMKVIRPVTALCELLQEGYDAANLRQTAMDVVSCVKAATMAENAERVDELKKLERLCVVLAVAAKYSTGLFYSSVERPQSELREEAREAPGDDGEDEHLEFRPLGLGTMGIEEFGFASRRGDAEVSYDDEEVEAPDDATETSTPAADDEEEFPSARSRKNLSVQREGKEMQCKVLVKGAVQSSGVHPVKAGWLTKRGGKMKTWKRRWFMCEDHVLYYYKDDKLKACLGRVPLPGLRVTHGGGGLVDKEHVFMLFKEGHRTYFLRGDDFHVSSAWVDFLTPLCESSAVVDEEAMRPVNSRTSVILGRDSASVQKQHAITNDDMRLELVNNVVVAGDKEMLLDRVCGEGEADPDFVDVIALTFRHFMKPQELLDALVHRLQVVPPADATAEQIRYVESQIPVIRQRTSTFLCNWVNACWFDFHEDADMIVGLTSFMDILRSTGDQTLAEHVASLERGIETQTRAYAVPRKSTVFELVVPTPNVAVEDFDAGDVARQLLLKELHLFKEMRREEFIVQLWGNVDKRAQAQFSAPLTRFIEYFNELSYMVASEICLTPSLEKRVLKLKSYITIGKAFAKYKNYNGVMAIVSGLNLAAVQRLKKTWGRVPAKFIAALHSLELLMNPASNYASYRSQKWTPPMIPFFGLYIKDLTFANDGNEKKTADGLVNVQKLRMIRDSISSLMALKETRFDFKVNEDIQAAIAGVTTMQDEKTLYKYSLLCEPRGKAQLSKATMAKPEVRLIEKWQQDG